MIIEYGLLGVYMIKQKYKISLKVIFILSIIIGVYFLNSTGIFKNANVEDVKNYILSFGKLAPLVYTIMFTLSALTLFPDSVLAISGGMIFGFYYGILYTIIGAILAASLGFFLSRILGQNIVNKFLKNNKLKVINSVENKGFISVFILRLIPLVPFDIISYGAGLTKVSYVDYITATALGIVPGVLIYINIGNQVGSSNLLELLKAVAMLFFLIGISYIIKQKGILERIIGISERHEAIGNNKM